MSSRISQHSGLMISTLPPPRPVSVNSLARAPATPPLPFQKTSRSTSADIQILDGPDLSVLSNPHVQCHGAPDTEMSDSQWTPVEEPRSQQRFELRFENLPVEIHDAILDHLFGERASTLTTTTPGKSSARSWSKALRHPRRKALSNLALISPIWRPLVQDRIYRHSELCCFRCMPPVY